MFWRKRQTQKCEHDWHELNKGTDKELNIFGKLVVMDYANIYCPVCDAHRKVDSESWVLMYKAQQIKKSYNIR